MALSACPIVLGAQQGRNAYSHGWLQFRSHDVALGTKQNVAISRGPFTRDGLHVLQALHPYGHISRNHS
jgi:hypothetical protein